MKILLTILPLFWPKMPPLGIAYLQSHLINKGINLDIMDLNNVFYNLANDELKRSWLINCNNYLEKNIISIIKNNNFSEFNAAIIKMLQYDIVGFSCFKSNFKSTLEIIRILKSHKRNIKIILGGPEITRQFYKTKSKFNKEIKNIADIIVIGEGERGLYGFVKGQFQDEKLIKFLELEDLNDAPYPKFEGLNLDSYPQKNSISLQFSRGCIRRCSFCSERLLYKGLRTRSVNSVSDEIKYHIENNKIKYFVFFDSFLNADTKKLESLCDGIISNFGSVGWEAQFAINDSMKDGIFRKIKESGCYNLFLGLESGCDATLGRMNKGFNTKQALEFFKKLNHAGINFGISMIVGYPGETEREFRESLEFIIKNKNLIPKIEQVNPFTYYDGTDADQVGDYKLNPESIRRMDIFVSEIKKNNLRYTNAFLGNLIEKNHKTRNAS